ncbi:MAG: twin-arginine translocation signal domain-containing protein, partial [Thermoanaerobaculia bacterium]
MARTPLFAMIQRCLRNAHSSLETGVPLFEILDQAAEARVTRRQFLAAGATAAAAASLAACTTFPSSSRGED